ncbi:hypothetical protein H072_6991 [Dactylellina haptotyla CBS 200.50]|uniref:J domain-containing protein n=1 Tax=Dactylellina haptotyla (strain CBS 200.50) TaxID=1284197 RepID=S8BV62_DACHA|nr:hypothetical protein H072_6991 [Dactylellina haptotyla CBS 200.50]
MPTESEAVEFANSPGTTFYELLNIEITAPAKDVRRAYRKTALQYHPDKNPDNPSAVEKFHLLTAALEILCDVALRAAYDNTLAAKAAKKARTEQYDKKRRDMKEELEARENSFKRQKTEVDEKKREFEMLKQEGAKRRMEMDERKKKEAAAIAAEESAAMEVDQDDEPQVVGESKFTELDRTVKIKWRRKGAGELMDRAGLIDLFSRFGAIDECVVVGGSGEKEKKYTSALVIFRNIAHAYAAVHRDKKALELEDDEWGLFRDVVWASGKEPDLEFTKPPKSKRRERTLPSKEPDILPSSIPNERRKADEEDKFPTSAESYKPASKPPPSFSFKASSFKKPTSSETPTASADSDYESITLMRMKARAAEKRKAEQERLAQELLQREAEEEKAEKGE